MRWSASIVCAIFGMGCAPREDAIAVTVSTPSVTADAGPCAVFAGGTDLDPCAATYLGGPGSDEANAVDVGADGSIFVGGSLAGNDFGLTPIDLQKESEQGGAGAEPSGAIIRLDTATRHVVSIARIGSSIADLDVGSSGDIAIAGDFGVARLDPTATSVRWIQALAAPASRVSLGSDGMLGALDGKAVVLFDDLGASAGNIELSDDGVEDIVIDGATHSVVVTGSNPSSVAGCATGVAFVRSYAYSGQVRWDDYDFQSVNIAPHCSSTTGRRVALGRDGKLYFGGESTGGDTIFASDPVDIMVRAPLVVDDAYSNPYNAGRAQIAFVARLRSDTGALETGVQMVARAETEAAPPLAASLTVRALTADQQGNVLVGGTSQCCIAHREALTISGQPIGSVPATGAEGYALLLSSDFATRRLWTTFTRSAAAATNAVASSNGTNVVVATAPSGGTLMTKDALQSEPMGGTEAFVASWKTR